MVLIFISVSHGNMYIVTGLFTKVCVKIVIIDAYKSDRNYKKNKIQVTPYYKSRKFFWTII